MISPYRIIRPSGIAAQSSPGTSNADRQAREFGERLVKLMPAEVAGIYTGVRGVWLPNAPAAGDLLQLAVLKYWLPAGGLLLVIALRVWGTRRPGYGLGDVQWGALCISVAAYLVWIAALGDPVFGFTVDRRIPASLLIIGGVLAPMIYRGTEQ
jgi:hypothetical protein